MTTTVLGRSRKGVRPKTHPSLGRMERLPKQPNLHANGSERAKLVCSTRANRCWTPCPHGPARGTFRFAWSVLKRRQAELRRSSLARAYRHPSRLLQRILRNGGSRQARYSLPDRLHPHDKGNEHQSDRRKQRELGEKRAAIHDATAGWFTSAKSFGVTRWPVIAAIRRSISGRGVRCP